MVGSGNHDIVEYGLKEYRIRAFTKEKPPSGYPRAVVPRRSGKTFRSPLNYTRFSAIRSAVSRDDENKVMRDEVPECLMDTDQGVTLVQRLLADDWSFYLKDVLKIDWLNPAPCGKLKRIARGMGLAKPPIRECTICGMSTRSKCMACHGV